jgi:uncharacterized membrane protein SpoIIM required for sporulation
MTMVLTIKLLKEKFKEYNKSYFENKLKMCNFSLYPSNYEYARFSPQIGQTKARIWINKKINWDEELLKNTLLTNYIIIIIFTIIGFSFFFFPINILILFYKSFLIGFTLSSFILTYSFKGLLLSIIYIFPHLIINILLFSLLMAFTTQNSINMIKYIIKKQNINMRHYFNKYFSILLIVSIILLFTGLYESYIMTNLLKMIVNI